MVKNPGATGMNILTKGTPMEGRFSHLDDMNMSPEEVARSKNRRKLLENREAMANNEALPYPNEGNLQMRQYQQEMMDAMSKDLASGLGGQGAGKVTSYSPEDWDAMVAKGRKTKEEEKEVAEIVGQEVAKALFPLFYNKLHRPPSLGEGLYSTSRSGRDR